MEEPAAVHRYRARSAWEGSTALGYEHFGRSHRVRTPPVAQELVVTADRAFRGRPEEHNPEQLLLMAASSCQLLSFLAVAARARLDVVAYVDDAEAVMPETGPGTAITAIVLRPSITVRPPATAARVERLTEVAHRECFIANSLRCAVTIEPTVVVVSEPTAPSR